MGQDSSDSLQTPFSREAEGGRPSEGRPEEGNMQTPRDWKTEVCPVLRCDGGNVLPSPADESTSHFLVSQTSPPRSGGSAPKPEAQGRGFLKKRFPFLLNRKEAAESLQGRAASQSRLCVESSHESPIQAFRKPATRGQPWGPDLDDDSIDGKMGSSLFRKLLCLKAKSSKRKKPPGGLEVSPLNARCGPVAALSRAADPHGESPLRWKPRADAQSPTEAGSIAEPERTGPVSRLGALCATKPWKTFRAMMSSGAKKGAVLPGHKRSHRTTEDGRRGLSPEPETSPATTVKKSSREPQSHTPAAGDKTPLTLFPSDAAGTCGTQKEKESQRQPARPGLHGHGRAGDVSEPAAEELSSLGEEHSRREKEPPVHQSTSEPDVLQRRVSDVSGVSVVEAEGEAMEDGGGRYWVEGWAGGDQDLADLAENPGGQGMVMGMRDLGWLNSELLGGPTTRPAEQKMEVFTKSNPDAWETEEKAVIRDIATGCQCTEETLGPAAEDGYARPEQQPSVAPSPPRAISGDDTLQEWGAPQETDLPTSLKLHPAFLSRGRGWLESPLDLPALELGSSVNATTAGATSQPQRTAQRVPQEPAKAAESSASEDAQSKRRIYRAAVEIVGAAIDAAAEQLVQKEVWERARSRGPEDDTAEAPVPGGEEIF